MKIKLIFIASVFCAFATIAFSQSVIITPKKVTYTRKPNPDFKERRRFTVTYPVGSGASSLALKKNIENTISYWRLFETTLAQVTEDYFLTDAYYQVNYNKNGILDIALTQEGVGAYPDSQTFDLVVDLKTGKSVSFDEVFKPESRAQFAALVNRKLAAEKREIINDINSGKLSDGDKEADASLKEQVQGLEFKADSFNEFSISDQGVTIFYDAEFAHAIQAAEPNGRYFFAWSAVKPFIKPAGLLRKFVR